MQFVIDANIVISALISTKGKTCDLLFSNELELFAPEFLLEEFEAIKKKFFQNQVYQNQNLNLPCPLFLQE